MNFLQMSNRVEENVAVENPDTGDCSEGSSEEELDPGSSGSGDQGTPQLFGPFHRPGNMVSALDKLISMASNHQSEKSKRKNLRKVQDSVVSDAAIDAQQKEKERLDRLALKRPSVSLNTSSQLLSNIFQLFIFKFLYLYHISHMKIPITEMTSIDF